MVWYTASVCSSVVPSGLDLFIAQLMNLVETTCLLDQCSRPRLLACFGSRRVPRSAALLPWHAQRKKINVGRRGTNKLHLVTLVPCALLAYLSSPIHSVAPWPAAIITTIAPRSIGPWYQMMFNTNLLAFDANYLNLENYAFDAKYSDLEYFDRRLSINKIAPTLCIYEIFTDNFVVSWASTCTPSHAHDLVLGRSLNHVQRVQSFAHAQQI